MAIKIIKASLFEAPPNSILLHACNCRGQWGNPRTQTGRATRRLIWSGGGIALLFREKYPESYQLHVNHCASHPKDALLGTTQLIACPEDATTQIACLFTSDRGGKRCDSPPEILDATRRGLIDLKQQVARLDGEWSIAACKFNSGIFKVPWDQSQAIIEEVGLDVDLYVP
ncbi:ADP-ribose 1''-phosphate phosphatase [Taphrina deformans PYCC 5710]|uniref:ADP-ribose 1''-phosphate phosphatase n=1 Tax=Taphrina deformans (strain PYCC 5710 / ATCC 11124 / CBS 356.35 / IMI 108563 / JCM 9778 / NBRC 8474) TaxID=1097556 RepID=R4X991_TAPDE|nr:ADP-ribose 1''-phosphate phosphatase [Taphrina deformans PYCC 5710]|eukprot:CCG80747.1 ADP-ribose 1''-phosphate phosphatase [Taphrina deformans PYCC 5710]